MGGLYEMTDGTAKKYYALASMTLAMHDGHGLQYLLSDHLGSLVAITDSSGTLTSQQRYLPFGQIRTDVPSPNPPGTDFGYTFQRHLAPLGLMDYRARFYDPALGRFTQPLQPVPPLLYPLHRRRGLHHRRYRRSIGSAVPARLVRRKHGNPTGSPPRRFPR